MTSKTLQTVRFDDKRQSPLTRKMAIRASWSETELMERRAKSRRLQAKLLRGLADIEIMPGEQPKHSTFLSSCVSVQHLAN